MAKAPKKREKKGSKVDFKRKEVEQITNHCYQRVKFLGDCFHDPRAMGIQKLWTNLTGPYHEVGMNSFLRHLVRDMDWSMCVACYFRDQERPEIIHCAQVSAVFRDVNMQEVSENLSSVIIECINRALDTDERYTNDNFIYYAYVLMPEFHNSHFTICDGLSSLMINLDDISEFPPFGENLPGRPSSAETLPLAIKNNGIWPKVGEVYYWNDTETDLEDVVLQEDFIK